MCTCVCIPAGLGKESLNAGGQRRSGASEGTNPRASGEKPALGKREYHPENSLPCKHTQCTTRRISHTAHKTPQAVTPKL